MPWPFDYHVIDLATLYYAWSLVAGETGPRALAAPGGEPGGAREGPVPHRAMADARLTLDTFRHYVGRLALRRPPSDDPPAPAR